MKSVSAYMQQNFMTEENLATLLTSMGEPFSLIVRNQGDIFELDKSAEAYQFFEQLVARKFATNRDASKTSINIYIEKALSNRVFCTFFNMHIRYFFNIVEMLYL